jgi:excisionase family DNA binding protein
MRSHAKQPAELHSNSAPLLTKEEVSKLLSVSTRHIERQVRAGRLRALKLSHKIVRFSRRDLDAFIASSASFFVPETGVAK